jgi:hypothetical protein
MIDLQVTSVTARTDSFEGLHVLLVTEDEARAQAIAKSLRERKAHVGDVRAGAKDPVAMRGADLLVIDARRSSAIDTRVGEVRSDVRARWASVATIDYTSLVGSEGTVDLRALEGVVSRLAGMDKALTERARKEERFETTLAPLGPTRTLRALALAGPTLHVKLSDGELNAKLDLAHELLVSAVADRKGERWEAWSALARVIGMTDANVVVERRANATVMNIMEPVDQALETAANERAQHPELFAEERSEELSGLLRGERRSEPAQAAQAGQAGKASGSIAPVARARTLVGVPAPTAPSQRPSPSSKVPPAPVPPGSLKAPQVPRESFADTPTDPAAPGLLQRMARSPANDAEIEIRAKIPSEPILEVEKPAQSERNDEDFDDENSDYDAGEVTVVADASQLDILRQTLDRMDLPKGPLTSTMPAPKGDSGSDDLELDDVLRNAAKRSEPTEPTEEAPTPARDVATAPPAAPPVAEAPQARTLRLDPSERPPAKSGSRTWILIALVLTALAALGWLYSTQQHKSAKPKPAASAPR